MEPPFGYGFHSRTPLPMKVSLLVVPLMCNSPALSSFVPWQKAAALAVAY